MPGSTVSLDSLSSPPSISPSPSPTSLTEPTNLNEIATAALDLGSDSDLSELTEDEQDQDTPPLQSNIPDDKPQSQSRPSRRGRRKRSSIVPAPMWGWAETKTPAEEEEEEVEEEEEEEEEEPTAGRPAVMEEEEEEEEESTSRSEPRRARPRLTQRRARVSNIKLVRQEPVESESEDNNAAAGPSKTTASDDELEFIRDKHVYQKSLNSRYTKSSSNMKPTRKASPKSESDNDNRDRPTTTVSNRKPATRGRPPRKVGRPSRKYAQLGSPPVEVPVDEKETDPLAVVPKEEQIKVAVSSAAPRPYEWEDWEASDFSTPDFSPSPKPAPVASDASMNQGPPPPVPPLPPSADIPISIMAESVDPPADVVVPAVSTEAPPQPTKDEEPTEKENVRDMEVEPEVESATNGQDPLPSKVDVKAIVDDTAADVVVPDPIAQVEVIEERLPSPEREQEPVPPEPENEPEPEQEPEQDRSMEVSDPSPEDIEMEMETETDLQPAHRAEALDVLASIELKFALLRERVYVEKMESLAWEESLVLAGTHPELIHLHLELSKRKDKRLELATRKRAYEAGDETSNSVGNARKRREADEAGVWGWWKHERNELQTDMISETNRKRRRLERERRAVERPQAVRRIPEFSNDVSLPPPPTIRQIIKTFPFGSTHDANRTRRGKGKAKPAKLVFPELGTLTAGDIQHDLSVIFHQHRRPTASYEGTVNVHRMGGNHMNGDAHNEMGIGMPPSFGGSGSRISQSQSLGPLPPFQHHQSTAPALNGHAQFAASSSGRIHHQNNYYSHGHTQSQLPFGVVDADMSGPGPSQAHQPHHQYYGSQGGPGYSGNGTGGRRSISPVTVGVSGKQNGNGTWMGIGMGFPGPMMEDRRSDVGMNMGMGGMIEDEERVNRARRNNNNMKMKEREMDRDREREREQLEIERERERFLMQQQQALQQQQQQQQHRHSQAQHQHAHVPQGQPPHHHVVPHHHHHHHHHVVHHHHAQQPQSGPGGPPPAPNGSGPPMSPSRAREFDRSAAPTPTHPTELINLSATKLLVPHWKGDGPSSSDYRDRNPSSHIGRPSSGPSSAPDDRERPLATPYVMASTHTMPTNIPPPPSSGASPRGAWNPPEENGSFRVPPSGTPAGYLGPQLESQGIHNSPRYAGPMGRGPPQSVPGAQSLTRQNSIGVSPPHPRSIPPPPSPKASSSSSTLPYAGPIRSPTRFGPPAPPRSPTNVNLKIPRSISPVLGSKMMGTQQQPSNSVYSPPRLGGPGRASTPTGLGTVDLKNGNTTMNSSGPTATAYTVGSKPSAVASPFPSLASSHPNLPPLSRPPNLSGPSDRRPSSPHHLPPVPPAQKMTVDGH